MAEKITKREKAPLARFSQREIRAITSLIMSDKHLSSMVASWPAVRVNGALDQHRETVLETWSEASGVPLHKIKELAPRLFLNRICQRDGTISQSALEYLDPQAAEVLGTDQPDEFSL